MYVPCALDGNCEILRRLFSNSLGRDMTRNVSILPFRGPTLTFVENDVVLFFHQNYTIAVQAERYLRHLFSSPASRPTRSHPHSDPQEWLTAVTAFTCHSDSAIADLETKLHAWPGWIRREVRRTRRQLGRS